MPVVYGEDQPQQQAKGKVVYSDQPSDDIADKSAGAGAIGAAALIGSILLRNKLPALTKAAQMQKFLDDLHGNVVDEITKDGLPGLGREYRAFVTKMGATDPSYVPKVSDFLAAKGVDAPKTMQLIEQAKYAGSPKTSSEINSALTNRETGAQQRVMDAYGDASTPSKPGTPSVRIRPSFWKQDPDEFEEQFGNMTPEQQAAVQAGVRQSLRQMPYSSFARRFLSTDPAYARDRDVFQRTLPADARTKFMQQFKAETMMHQGALRFGTPGSAPGAGMGQAFEAALDAADLHAPHLSLPLRALRYVGVNLGNKPFEEGNRLLFGNPEFNVEPGVGVDPNSYSAPALENYQAPSWKPGKVDLGIGAGAGALTYGLESEDQDQ